jgi:hypothetical protein
MECARSPTIAPAFTLWTSLEPCRQRARVWRRPIILSDTYKQKTFASVGGGGGESESASASGLDCEKLLRRMIFLCGSRGRKGAAVVVGL